MTPSISRKARIRIAAQPKVVKEFQPVRTFWDNDGIGSTNRPFTKHQLSLAADTLASLADFWEANPHRWIKGTALAANNGGQMCNIGVLGASLGIFDNTNSGWPALMDGIKPSTLTASFTKATTRKAITFTEAHVEFLVTLNDSAQSLTENVAGLRYAAQAYRNFAEGMSWDEAVDKAWAPNLKLLKVQIQRLSKKSPQTAKTFNMKLRALVGASA